MARLRSRNATALRKAMRAAVALSNAYADPEIVRIAARALANAGPTPVHPAVQPKKDCTPPEGSTS